MRLIDADKLIENIENTADLGGWIGDTLRQIKRLAVRYINSAPSIDIDRPQGWIPCSDCLPEEDGHYIVYAPSYRGGSSGGKEMHNGVMFSRFKNGKWSIEVGYHKRPGCVKAWMPIVPWKGEKNDD